MAAVDDSSSDDSKAVNYTSTIMLTQPLLLIIITNQCRKIFRFCFVASLSLDYFRYSRQHSTDLKGKKRVNSYGTLTLQIYRLNNVPLTITK